jgi:hypothetical protein
MPELRVPFAVDDENLLYSPATAEKGKNFFCPVCREPVILKHDEIKATHFAHKASDACNQETIIHQTAKLLVQKAIHEWKLGKKNSCPTLQRSCQSCDAPISQPLPEKVDGAVLEYKLPDGSVADVVLLVKEVPQATIEIRVAHTVDRIKTSKLSVPFVKLDGYEIIENPTVWKPVTDHFKPVTCDKCRLAYSKFQARVRQIAKASNVELPTAYYRYGLTMCWKCEQEILAFAWPESSAWNNSAPGVKPFPRTIQYRFSKTVGHKYWANTCPYCQSIQGDWHLHHEPEGPFCGIQIEEDSPTAFDADIMKIAQHAEEALFIRKRNSARKRANASATRLEPGQDKKHPS